MATLLVANYDGGNELVEYDGRLDFDEIWSAINKLGPGMRVLVKIFDDLVTFDGVFVTFNTRRLHQAKDNGFLIIEGGRLGTSLTPELFLEFLQNRIRLTFPSSDEITILGLQIL